MTGDMRFGLRYFEGNREIRLLQISGSGRLRLADATRKWWAKRTPETKWEIYPTDEGHAYLDADTAQSVVLNLTRKP